MERRDEKALQPMSIEKLKVIITGATGMVGEGVLQECLQHPSVEAVLILGRKPSGRTHPKLQEIVLPDLFDLSAVAAQPTPTAAQPQPGTSPSQSRSGPNSIESRAGSTPTHSRLSGYNACFFCLGVSSVGMSAEEYYRITYTLTLYIAETLSRLDPDMVFAYVSGAGTDSSEKGRSRWARVKGKTENDLMKLPFSQVYAFRPGFIRATPGQSNVHAFYKYINWLYPIGRALYRNGFVTNREIGLAMIHLALHRNGERIVDGNAIIRLAAAESPESAESSTSL